MAANEKMVKNRGPGHILRIQAIIALLKHIVVFIMVTNFVLSWDMWHLIECSMFSSGVYLMDNDSRFLYDFV